MNNVVYVHMSVYNRGQLLIYVYTVHTKRKVRDKYMDKIKFRIKLKI